MPRAAGGVATALAAALKALGPDIIFAGKQAVDDDASQTGERVAELLDWPHVSVVTRFAYADGKAAVSRETEGGHLDYAVPLPALFTVDKALNTPRYPTLPNIMKAKKKPIEEKSLADLGVAPDAVASDVKAEAMALPRQERLCKVLEGEAADSVRALVQTLRNEEKVF